MQKILKPFTWLLTLTLAFPLFNAIAVQNTDFLQDPEHQFWFSIESLPTIQLNFTTPQWEVLLTSTSSDREEVMGYFIFTQGGIEYPLLNNLSSG
jgi:hypothetical protein